ncbi:hypothetical protein DsansV1_C19g0155701 [Dioscorea sansibarensis]
MLTLSFSPNSVRNLEIIDPLHIVLWASSNKKRSLFHMLKTTKTIGRVSWRPGEHRAIGSRNHL